jgi:hypothetical protein
MDVEWAQLVGHDHIVDVLLSRFFQLKYEERQKKKTYVRERKFFCFYYNSRTSVMRRTSTLE